MCLYRESSFGVTDSEVRVMLPVSNLCRTASELRRPAVFSVVVTHRAVVHHGRNVREGTLVTERKGFNKHFLEAGIVHTVQLVLVTLNKLMRKI